MRKQVELSRTDKNTMRDELRAAELAKYNEEYFDTEWWKEDIPGKSGNRGLSYNDPDHNRRFVFLADALTRCFEFESFLDAGCGPGNLLDVLASKGKKVVGCDPAPAALTSFCERTRGLIDPDAFICSTISNLPFEDRQFDLVWCSDVMEHLLYFDIELAARQLSRVSAKYLALTINLDNPYHYHPTILSRPTWTKLFLETGMLRHSTLIEERLQRDIEAQYVEYDAFVFERI